MTNYPLSSLIAERVGEMKALAYVEARAARADKARVLDILSRVPERAPVQGDAIERPR